MSAPAVMAWLLGAALQAAPVPAYEALVRDGVAAARAGRHAEAETLLQRARALSPERTEARVELAGLRFVQGRYAAAADELGSVLRRQDTAHGRELMAASLHLAGRTGEALDHWNRLRRPVLRNLHLSGVHHTRSRIVVPQITLVEGALLTRGQVGETEKRLRETGVFDVVRLRPVPLADGQADVEASVRERHGFGHLPEFVALTASKALQRTAWLQVHNLDGSGVSVAAGHRWQHTQPRTAVAITWPRPLGLDATLRASGSWQAADYAVGTDGLRLERRGAAVGLRHVLDGRTVVEVGWAGSRREFTSAGGLGPVGRTSGLSLGLERVLLDGIPHRLDVQAEGFASLAALGAAVRYSSGRLAVRHRWSMLPGEQGTATIERLALASRLVVAGATAGAPLDAHFTPGTAAEAELPLRAHRARRDGVLGGAPIARSVQLLNVEGRAQVARLGLARVGIVLFYDGLRAAATIQTGRQRFFHDAGVGIRVGLLGILVRADHGWALNGPPSRAFTVGLGPTF